MKIVRDYEFVEPEDRGAVVAIGNFDGVHLGHQAVIARTREIARELAAPSGVITFEPHPRQLFQPDAPPFRLTNAQARATRLQKLGVDKLYELNFNHALASLTAEEFAERVLKKGLGVRHVLIGEDFRFGKGRGGDAALMERLGQELGFGVTVMPLVRGELGEVSSTAIREALSEGRPRDAQRLLGHWHRIEGPVIGGEQRGRLLGYPTANIALEGLHRPRYGVYATLVDVLGGPHAGSYKGVASLGVRPMFDGQEPNLEVHLFDFAGDLYGAPLSVGLVEFLRPEERFETVDALIRQMDEDSRQAREILEKVT